MKKKKLATLIGVVGISLSTSFLTACSNNQVNNVKNEKSSKQTAQKSVTSSSKKESNINNDEWMMMGYVAYRAKDSNDSSALNEVESNLNSNDLSVTRNSANSYTFSNGYGSVNVKVENDKVVVSNDGTSTFSKESLEKSFKNNRNTIRSLTNKISSSTTTPSSTNKDGKWKTGIPSDLIGSYKNSHREEEQNDLQTVIVYDFWKDSFTFWQSSDLTRFATDVKYKKSGNSYTLKFNEMDVGGGYHLPEDSPELSNGLKYRKVPDQQITIVKEGNDIRVDNPTINGDNEPLLFKSNSYTLAKTPNNMYKRK